MWSLLWVCIQTGVGHTNNESVQHFDSPTTSQHNILSHRQRVSTTFWLRKTITNFSCAPDRVQTSGLWISSRCSYHWATPSLKTHITVTVENVNSYIIQFWRLQWGRQHKVEETERAPAGQSHVVALGQVPQGVESLRGPGRGGQGGDGHHGHVPWGRPHLPSHVQQQHQQQQTATIGGRDDRPSSHRKQGCWRYMCVCVCVCVCIG